MMARNKPYSGSVLLAMLIAMLATVALVACNSPTYVPQPLDLSTVAACPAEDGPGLTGPAPCVFDGGAVIGPDAAYGVRWVYYSADNTCPVNTVQDPHTVHCVMREDWTGGTGSGEGRTN